MSTNNTPKFNLGQTVMTQGITDLVNKGCLNYLSFLRRHAQGDWGDLCDEDKKENNRALKTEGRLFSCYQVAPKQKIYIITEWDRSYTTILLPSEY